MIVVTAATGKLGLHVVDELLKRVPASQIAVTVRNPEKAKAAFAGKGVEIRHADYSKPETLKSAFAGAEKILFISGNEFDTRPAQHKSVVDAAKAAGVKLLAYTSILNNDKTRMVLANDHKTTEAAIKASGVPYVFLRNGWYHENYTENLGPALEHGALLGSSGNGKISAAARVDYAAAAAVVLTTDGHSNKTYELGGDTAFTLTELAAEVSKQAKKPVEYKDLPEKAYADFLASVGLPAPVAAILADASFAISKGDLEDTSGDLHRLIGRATTRLADAVHAAVAKG